MTEDSSQELRDLLFFKGFEEVARGIAKRQGIPVERARAILAAGTRRAGTAARKKNPALNRVPGGRHNPRNKVHKAVILGRTYDQPIPMPMLANGMPDWNAPDINSYVSLLLDGSPKLKGRVVVLHRRPNGMYTIAVDGEHVAKPEDRGKDKSKLRKEDQMVDQEQYDTPVGENVILKSMRLFNNYLKKSFPYQEPFQPDYFGDKYSYFMIKGGKAIVAPRGFGPLHPKAKLIQFADPINRVFRKSLSAEYFEEYDLHYDNHAMYKMHKRFIDSTIQKVLDNR